MGAFVAAELKKAKWDSIATCMHIYRSHHHDVPGLCCAGDGRNDSPGHSAQYLQYTLMEEESSGIMSIEFVDKREADLKSPNMEPIGLRRSIEALQGDGQIIAEVVTDAHVQIPKIFGKLSNFVLCDLLNGYGVKYFSICN